MNSITVYKDRKNVASMSIMQTGMIHGILVILIRPRTMEFGHLLDLGCRRLYYWDRDGVPFDNRHGLADDS